MKTSTPHGDIDQSAIDRKNDYLFRISIKALIKNENGDDLAFIQPEALKDSMHNG
jgi:hypothetical protein